MLKTRPENTQAKTIAYQVFHDEFHDKQNYFDLNHLSKVTGLSYIKLYRIVRGDFDFKADDFLKICLALGRADLIARVVRKLKDDIEEKTDFKIARSP